jgi:quercetin dioxygenase-like cupin family protein
MKRITFTIVAIFMCIVAKSQYNKEILVEPILKTDTTLIGQGFNYPDLQKDEITILKITIKPGKSTGWHKHEFPVFAYILKGDLTVEFENNKALKFSKNSSFSEVINKFHNGINKGKKKVVMLAFYMGEKGKALSVHKEAIN